MRKRTKSRQISPEKKRCILWMAGVFALFFYTDTYAQVNELRATDSGPFQLLATNDLVEEPTPVNSAGPAATEPSTTETSLQGPSKKSAVQQIDFAKVISKMAMSTLVVLGLCIAALVVFKKFRLDSRLLTSSKPVAGDDQHLKVEATLRLGRCNTLYIVQAGSSRLAVGTDATGVKSIVPIGSVFSQNLERVDAEQNRTELTDHEKGLISEQVRGQKTRLARFGNYPVGNPIL